MGRGHRRRFVAIAPVVLMLAGCGSAGHGTSQPTSAAPTSQSGPASGLDALAEATGALPDAATTVPTGRYGRRVGGDVERFCLVPEADRPDQYRFGAEMRLGARQACVGHGTAHMTSAGLVLDFAGAAAGDCRVTATYEGDRIVMPGHLDPQCSALCTGRGSFAGVTFPRIDRDVGAARAMTRHNGRPLCR